MKRFQRAFFLPLCLVSLVDTFCIITPPPQTSNDDAKIEVMKATQSEKEAILTQLQIAGSISKTPPTIIYFSDFLKGLIIFMMPIFSCSLGETCFIGFIGLPLLIAGVYLLG